MKKLSILKIKDLTPMDLNVSEMGNLIGGIEGGGMLRAYGCDSYVCTNDKTTSEKKCTTEECKDTACHSGA